MSKLAFKQFGKYTTRVEGSKEQLEELRGKLHDLGISINDGLYLELIAVPQEINDLKQKYNISKTNTGISLYVPNEQISQIDSFFNSKNTKQLYFPGGYAKYDFTREGNKISVSLPNDCPLPESRLIINSLKLLKLYPSK